MAQPVEVFRRDKLLFEPTPRAPFHHILGATYNVVIHKNLTKPITPA